MISCDNVFTGGISKKKWTVEYPNILSAIRPAPHGDELPVPNPTPNDQLLSDDDVTGSRV